MKTLESKKVILASLDEMDKSQTDKVLDYIQGLLMGGQERVNYSLFKESAMKQINQALKEG